MPAGDGTGPTGKGPLTGRGLGKCVVSEEEFNKNWNKRFNGRSYGRGLSKGFGRGFQVGGRGGGGRRRFW